MPRFFVTGDNISETEIRITGSDASHIMRSLRMKTGEAVTVCDMHCIEYECVIEDFESDCVVLKINSSCPGNTEPPYSLTLYQALPKSDKMEFIIQKAVETGAGRIVPFISERCISRPDKKSARSKSERWNKISLEAAKQCGRGIVPVVEEICSFDEALNEAKLADVPILFYEGDNTKPLRELLGPICPDPDKEKIKISVIIGSEGGFSCNEVERAAKSGISVAGLGPRILRCETAPVVALGAISYALEM